MRIKFMVCAIAVTFPLGAMAQGTTAGAGVGAGKTGAGVSIEAGAGGGVGAVQPGGGTTRPLGAAGSTGAASGAMSGDAKGTAGVTGSVRGSPAAATPQGAVSGSGSLWQQLDANKDGFVTREEARGSADISARFNQLDKDGDGRLSPQELSGWRQAPAAAGRTTTSSPTPTAAAVEPPSSSRPARSRPRIPVDRSYSDPGVATFNSFDTNRDGYITKDEARESTELSRRFNELDKDGDGKLSLRELTGWHSLAYVAR